MAQGTFQRITSIGLKTRLIAGFSAMVALAFVCGLFGVFMADQFKQETTAMLEGPVEEISKANYAWEDILLAQYAQMQFMVTKDEAAVADFDHAVEKARKELHEIEENTENQEWKSRIEQVFADIDTFEHLFH